MRCKKCHASGSYVKAVSSLPDDYTLRKRTCQCCGDPTFTVEVELPSEHVTWAPYPGGGRSTKLKLTEAGLLKMYADSLLRR